MFDLLNHSQFNKLVMSANVSWKCVMDYYYYYYKIFFLCDFKSDFTSKFVSKTCRQFLIQTATFQTHTLNIRYFLCSEVLSRRIHQPFNSAEHVRFTVCSPYSAFCLSVLLCLWVLMWTFETDPWNNSSTKWPCEFVYPHKP